MKGNKFLPFGLFVVVLVLVSLACNFSATTANITNAHMATDESDSTQTTVYSPDTQTFYCFYDLNNAPDDTVVRGAWTLVSAEGYDANSEIDSAEITGSDDTYYFSLDRAADVWPVGQYKIDLYINDKLAETVEFQVQ
ncbi:MAG TPA: hypothetical protein VFR47_16540 [Anaerolineales bacterium]|nr:hypothetical protein [Anaerolineales bacterium]